MSMANRVRMQRSRTNLLSLWRMSRKKDGHCKQQKRGRGGEGEERG